LGDVNLQLSGLPALVVQVGFILIPLSFLLAFKYVLGTSFLGAIGLAIVAILGYVAMVHFLGSGFDFSGTPASTTV
jgi:hypothetical protein